MTHSIRIGLTGLAFLLSAALAQAHTSSDLQNELNAVAGEIESARASAASVGEPAVRELTEQRLAMLRLTQAILRNRILMLEGGGVEPLAVPVTEPDMLEVAAIVSEMSEVEAAIADAESRLATAEGVDRAIAATRLESEKLALAQLRIAYIDARFGAVAEAPSGFEFPEPHDSVLASDGDAPRQRPPAWADPRHPGVDYTNPLFQMAYNSGARISGWWTISGGRGGDSFTAQNLSQYFPDAALADRGMLLQIRCSADASEISVSLPGRYLAGYDSGSGQAFDVAYRVDGGVLGRDEWLATSGGDGARLDSEAALDLIDDLYSARSLFLEISDGSRMRHSAEFDLAGYYDVESIAEDACAQPSLALSRNDYRLIQTLLNIAGFNAGPADGIWGRNSERALRNYQDSAGLPATGRPNRATLELLGLME